MHVTRRTFGSLIASMAIGLAGKVLADDDEKHGHNKRDDDDDHVSAKRLRKSGDVLPLREILEEVRKTYKGEIVGIEFEKRKDGVWVYEFKMVTPEGRYLEVYVDAKTKRIIKVGGK